MIVAIVGSRSIRKINNIESYLPKNIEKIVSGGAVGVDKIAYAYAIENEIEIIEILPDYAQYGRRAPLVRNREIVEISDILVAFWDGSSRGTVHTIRYAKSIGKKCKIYIQGKPN